MGSKLQTRISRNRFFALGSVRQYNIYACTEY